MKKMNEKMYKKVTEQVVSKFKDAAAWIVDEKCTEPETGIKIIGEQRDILIAGFSNDMALGSLMTKNKYLLIGGVTGVVLSAGIMTTYVIIKKRQNGGKPQTEEN